MSTAKSCSFFLRSLERSGIPVACHSFELASSLKWGGVPRKRTIILRAAIEGKNQNLFLVAKYASQHGKYRGQKAKYILPLLLATVNPLIEAGVTGTMLFNEVLDFLGIDPTDLT